MIIDADEDVGVDEGEQGEHADAADDDKPRQRLIADELAAAVALLRQEDDNDESRAPVPPRGCTRAAREARISKGNRENTKRRRREGEREIKSFVSFAASQNSSGRRRSVPKAKRKKRFTLSLPSLLRPSRQERERSRCLPRASEPPEEP